MNEPRAVASAAGRMTDRRFWAVCLMFVCALSVSVVTQARDTESSSKANSTGSAQPKNVEIRWTGDDIPHVLAADWRGLGFGVGYTQASDALCTLAEGFVTYAGRRSYFWGADAKPALNSTLGRPRNLELDLFFHAFVDQARVERFRAAQPSELIALSEGFAAGYNRVLGEQRRAGKVSCAHAPWLREIGANDVFRRMIAAQFAAGYARFIPQIVNAKPAVAATADSAALRDRLRFPVGDQEAIGSNMIAVGGKASGGQGGALLGNPHWFWGGPDRFYQMHLSIPGRLNVAGIAFLGVPVVMIGFNDNVAWSHTVSEARRFGLFDLTLDPADPTRYRIDGKFEPMRERRVAVEVRGEDGRVESVVRTLYETRFGPVIDLGAQDPAFGWGRAHALAIRDINASNDRVFRHFFDWNQARSLADFIAIQQRAAALPWVNTAAIGRDDNRVWYADMGAVPNVPDTLRERCATPLAQGFAKVDPLTPLLDGSRPDCDWQNDPDAMQPGAMPANRMPALLREDYVANMNDSYWLSNVFAPLEGYPAVLGGERRALSLRGRFGHDIALSLLREAPLKTELLAERLKKSALDARAYSAMRFKNALLDGACALPELELSPDPLTPAAATTPHKVNVGEACRVLRAWPNTGNSEDRGALLWDAFWTRLQEIPAGEFYRQPFDPAAPLDTPAAPNALDPRVAQALAAAVVFFERSGLALDAPLGSRRYAQADGAQLPLYGGCPLMGYFTVACNGAGQYGMDANAMANSYLQVVRFAEQGVEAFTLLAHGQRETALNNGAGASAIQRYARKDWLRFPFREADIKKDPQLRREVLHP